MRIPVVRPLSRTGWGRKRLALSRSSFRLITLRGGNYLPPRPLSPEGPASSRRRGPVPPIPGFAEAVGSPSTVTELVEASGATPAARFPRTPSAASLASVAMEVARDPTLASPRLVELLSPVFPRSVSPDDIQRMMGISPQEAARTAAAGFGKADMVPIDPADAEEM